MSKNLTVIGHGDIHVLVLSGWMGDHTVFEPTFSLWNQDKFTLAFMDYRGYGKAKNISGDFTIEEIAEDAAFAISELGWNEVHLIGHSMGGMAAQKIAVCLKGKIKSLIGIAPVPASGFPMDENATALFAGAIKSDDKRKQILDFTTGNKRENSWLDKMVLESRRTTTEIAYDVYLTAWAKTDFSVDAKKINIPMLILVGESDPAVNKEFVDKTFGTWFKNCEIEILKDSGHYPMQEAPTKLVQRIELFYDEL